MSHDWISLLHTNQGGEEEGQLIQSYQSEIIFCYDFVHNKSQMMTFLFI